MPLNSLRESIQTLAELTRRSRELRQRNDLPIGALEQIDRMVDETIDTMKDLVDVLSGAHRTGDLDEMVRRDNEENSGSQA
jgi:hypothetical protein